MTNRGGESAVMPGQHEQDALLAAFLEATHRIDLRALRKHAASEEMPRPVNVESQVEIVTVALLDGDPPKAAVMPFALRRANLVRGS
jgi:hypothetical protein